MWRPVRQPVTGQKRRRDQEYHPAARSPRRRGFLQRPHQELSILRVRLVSDVEQVADERDRAQHRVDREVEQHPPEDDRGHAELRRDEEDVAADRRGAEVADAGDESEDRIEADLLVRAGDGDALIEQLRQTLDRC